MLKHHISYTTILTLLTTASIAYASTATSPAPANPTANPAMMPSHASGGQPPAHMAPNPANMQQPPANMAPNSANMQQPSAMPTNAGNTAKPVPAPKSRSSEAAKSLLQNEGR